MEMKINENKLNIWKSSRKESKTLWGMTSSRVMKYWSSGKNRKMHVLDKHQRFSGTGFGKDKTVKAKTNICKTNICRTKKDIDKSRFISVHRQHTRLGNARKGEAIHIKRYITDTLYTYCQDINHNSHFPRKQPLYEQCAFSVSVLWNSLKSRKKYMYI